MSETTELEVQRTLGRVEQRMASLDDKMESLLTAHTQTTEQIVGKYDRLEGRISELETFKSRAMGMAIGAATVIATLYGILWRVITFIK